MANAALNKVLHQLRSHALRTEGAGLADGELLDCFIAFQDEAACHE